MTNQIQTPTVNGSGKLHANGTSNGTRPRITVVGAGVTGLTCALELSSLADVTIVARNMPGDPLSLGWASPWAGAMWLPSGQDNGGTDYPIVSYRKLWDLAKSEPESSVIRIDCYDYRLEIPKDLSKTWYPACHDMRRLEPEEMLLDSPAGVFYRTISLNPETYLPWLRKKCEAANVKFVRYDCRSLSEAAEIAPCDLICNATGVGSRHLQDVADDLVQSVRGQTMLVKCDLPDFLSCHLEKYTYIIPHGDGTATIGGIKEYYDFEPGLKEDVQRAIHARCHQLSPKYIPAKYEDLQIIRHNIGFRPERHGTVRCEAETSQAGKRIVHVYGMSGGYVYSWGLAKEARRLATSLLE